VEGNRGSIVSSTRTLFASSRSWEVEASAIFPVSAELAVKDDVDTDRWMRISRDKVWPFLAMRMT
jgi:hypothetical protein